MVLSFNKAVKSDQLLAELISAGLNVVVETVGETVKVLGNDELTQEQQDAIAALVEAHAPNNDPPFLLLTPRQVRLALFSQHGIVDAQVEEVINQLSEPDKTVAMIEWKNAVLFDRTYQQINLIGGLLGLTTEQIDALWRVGETY